MCVGNRVGEPNVWGEVEEPNVHVCGEEYESRMYVRGNRTYEGGGEGGVRAERGGGGGRGRTRGGAI